MKRFKKCGGGGKKKSLVLAVILCLVPTVCLAALTSVTFVPYSSAVAKSCSVINGDVSGSYFEPNVANSIVLSLGNKSEGTFTVGVGASPYIQVKCYPTSTGPTNAYTSVFSNFTGKTAPNYRLATFGSNLGTFVKMYFNSSSTVLHPVTDALLKVK